METKAAKEKAVKAYFEGKNITGANLDIAMRGCRDEIGAIELDGDKIKDTAALDALVNGTFAGLVVTKTVQGAQTANPPANMSEPKNLSQVLYLFTEGQDLSRGELRDFSTIKREESASSVIETGYPSFPASSGDRLKFSPEAADYFGEDGSYGPEASRRIRGNVLHGILSRVVVAQDLPAAVDAAVLSGELPSSSRDEAVSFLESRISSVGDRGWFSPDARIRPEESVLAPGEGEYRPDRVVIHPGGKVDIVDFKFGKEESKYLSQVRWYVNLYRRMGFEKVDGYLWYLDDNLINFVAD